MVFILFLLVLLVGCSFKPGRDEIYNISLRTDTLVARGDYRSARETLHAFLSEPFSAQAAYDSLLIGRLYARLAFLSRRDSLYQWAEPGIDRMAYAFYLHLPDTQRVHLYRWSARSALVATDTIRAFRLLAESFYLGLMLGDSLEMARTLRLWQTIKKAPIVMGNHQKAYSEGFPSIKDTLLIVLLIWAGYRTQKRIVKVERVKKR